MLSRHHRVFLHGVAAVLIAGVAVVATGGAGNAAGADKPESYGGDATAASFEYRLDKSPEPFPVTDPVHVWFPYAETSLDSSGGATGIASSIYPGQGVIGVPALLCEFAAQLCTSLPGGIPDYPAWAQAQYPSKPDASATLSQKPFPGTGPFSITPHSVTAHADPDRVEATTVMAGAELTGVVQASSATAHSEQHFDGGSLVLTAESVLKGIDIGGGTLHIDQLTSLATAKVDGGKVRSATSKTTVSGATVDGTAVTIDSTGIHVAGQGDSGAAKKQVNAALANLAAQGIDARALDDTRSVRDGVVKASTGGILVSYEHKVTAPVQPPAQLASVTSTADGDWFGTFTLGGAGVSAFASPAVPFGSASVPAAPTGTQTVTAAGAPPPAGTTAALPAGGTAPLTAPQGTAPALSSAPQHAESLGIDLTSKRLRTLALVLLGYPVLVLLGGPLRALARLRPGG